MIRFHKHISRLPTILGSCFVLCISIFALDVFSEYSGLGVILPLFIHLIPSFLLAGVTVIAGKYSLVGTIAYLGFAALYIWQVGFARPMSWYIAIPIPAAIVGLLYFGNWFQYRKRGKM